MSEVEDIRLEIFRQLKKEIRGSREYLIVGIDVAKEKHHAFFGTATGKSLLKRSVFENGIKGFSRMLSQAEEIQETQGLPKVVFGLKPTANYHEPIGEYGSNYKQGKKKAANQIFSDVGHLIFLGL